MNLLYTFLWVFACSFGLVFGVACAVIAGWQLWLTAGYTILRLRFFLRNFINKIRSSKFHNQ